MLKQELQFNNPQLRFLRIRQIMNLTGLSKSYIYELTAKGEFPQRVKLVKGGSSVAWVESEVLSWLEERLTDRNSNQ